MELSAEMRQFISEHAGDDIRQLALQGGKYPGIDLKMALQQIAGRQVIRTKLPSWYSAEELLYPAHLSLEQCSSEVTAHYKASLCSGETLVDLTGGFGVDCVFMAAGFLSAVYVERQEELCDLARHNFPLLQSPHIDVRHGDGVDFLQKMKPVDCIFIDPARRNEQGRKTVQLSDCEPDVSQLETLLLKKAGKVIIKLSPMLDISLALKQLPSASAVHILSVQNECKELLVVLDREVPDSVAIHCLNFAGDTRQEFHFTREDEQEVVCNYTPDIGKYLYEPNGSILKAGAYKSICGCYGVRKLHPSSHLYTSEECVENFPGRIFRVAGWGSVKDKNLLSGISKANIAVRNFPLSADELRKKLRLKEGGEVYLFGTTLADGSKVLIRCEKA